MNQLTPGYPSGTMFGFFLVFEDIPLAYEKQP